MYLPVAVLIFVLLTQILLIRSKSSVFNSFIAAHEDSRPCVFQDEGGDMRVGFGFSLKSKKAKDVLRAIGVDYKKFYNSGVTSKNDICLCWRVPCLSKEQITLLFDMKVEEVLVRVTALVPSFASLCLSVQSVIVDIGYSSSKSGFENVVKLIAKHLRQSNWQAVANTLKRSEWCRHHDRRCSRNTKLVTEGCKSPSLVRNRREIRLRENTAMEFVFSSPSRKETMTVAKAVKEEYQETTEAKLPSLYELVSHTEVNHHNYESIAATPQVKPISSTEKPNTLPASETRQEERLMASHKVNHSYNETDDLGDISAAVDLDRTFASDKQNTLIQTLSSRSVNSHWVSTIENTNPATPNTVGGNMDNKLEYTPASGHVEITNDHSRPRPSNFAALQTRSVLFTTRTTATLKQSTVFSTSVLLRPSFAVDTFTRSKMISGKSDPSVELEYNLNSRKTPSLEKVPLSTKSHRTISEFTSHSGKIIKTNIVHISSHSSQMDYMTRDHYYEQTPNDTFHKHTGLRSIIETPHKKHESSFRRHFHSGRVPENQATTAYSHPLNNIFSSYKNLPLSLLTTIPYIPDIPAKETVVTFKLHKENISKLVSPFLSIPTSSYIPKYLEVLPTKSQPKFIFRTNTLTTESNSDLPPQSVSLSLAKERALTLSPRNSTLVSNTQNVFRWKNARSIKGMLVIPTDSVSKGSREMQTLKQTSTTKQQEPLQPTVTLHVQSTLPAAHFFESPRLASTKAASESLPRNVKQSHHGINQLQQSSFIPTSTKEQQTNLASSAFRNRSVKSSVSHHLLTPFTLQSQIKSSILQQLIPSSSTSQKELQPLFSQDGPQSSALNQTELKLSGQTKVRASSSSLQASTAEIKQPPRSTTTDNHTVLVTSYQSRKAEVISSTVLQSLSKSSPSYHSEVETSEKYVLESKMITSLIHHSPLTSSPLHDPRMTSSAKYVLHPEMTSSTIPQLLTKSSPSLQPRVATSIKYLMDPEVRSSSTLLQSPSKSSPSSQSRVASSANNIVEPEMMSSTLPQSLSTSSPLHHSQMASTAIPQPTSSTLHQVHESVSDLQSIPSSVLYQVYPLNQSVPEVLLTPSSVLDQVLTSRPHQLQVMSSELHQPSSVLHQALTSSLNRLQLTISDVPQPPSSALHQTSTPSLLYQRPKLSALQKPLVTAFSMQSSQFTTSTLLEFQLTLTKSIQKSELSGLSISSSLSRQVLPQVELNQSELTLSTNQRSQTSTAMPYSDSAPFPLPSSVYKLSTLPPLHQIPDLSTIYQTATLSALRFSSLPFSPNQSQLTPNVSQLQQMVSNELRTPQPTLSSTVNISQERSTMRQPNQLLTLVSVNQSQLTSFTLYQPQPPPFATNQSVSSAPTSVLRRRQVTSHTLSSVQLASSVFHQSHFVSSALSKSLSTLHQSLLGSFEVTKSQLSYSLTEPQTVSPALQTPPLISSLLQPGLESSIAQSLLPQSALHSTLVASSSLTSPFLSSSLHQPITDSPITPMLKISVNTSYRVPTVTEMKLSPSGLSSAATNSRFSTTSFSLLVTLTKTVIEDLLFKTIISKTITLSSLKGFSSSLSSPQTVVSTVNIQQVTGTSSSNTLANASFYRTISTKQLTMIPYTLPSTTTTEESNDKTYLVELLGDCNDIIINIASFKISFIEQLSFLLNANKSDIECHRVTCGSVNVVFTIRNARTTNMTRALKLLLNRNSFNISFNGKIYSAFQVKTFPFPTQPPQVTITTPTSGIDKKRITLIAFATGGAFFCALFIVVCVIFCARTCSRHGSSAKFNVRNSTLLNEFEMKRFMPAVNGTKYYSKADFYGDNAEEREEMKTKDSDTDEEEEHEVTNNSTLLHNNYLNPSYRRVLSYTDTSSQSSTFFY